MSEPRRETVERRSGIDRRVSNWRDATHQTLPSPAEALALRACVDEVRRITTTEDFDVLDYDQLRAIVDRVEIALVNLDDQIKALHG